MTQPMRLSPTLAFLIVFLAACVSEAAGLRFIDVPADGSARTFSAIIWSPCEAPPREVKFRFLTVPALRDCPIVGGKLPLVVISHGSGGWFGGNWDTATALADAGFVVVALNHPGDTSTDRSRTDNLSILADRPGDIRRLTDFMFGGWSESPKLDCDRVGFFGFSRGAYTGMAVAGGKLDIPRIAALCPEGFINGMCEQLRNKEPLPWLPAPDRRFKAAVLADLEFGRAFRPEDLKGVGIPIQLWSSERGGDGVLPIDNQTINRSLPAKPDFHLVSGAGHFVFLAPCSAAAAKAVPEICDDPAGFDRTAFHKVFNAAVVAFFHQNLGAR
jgi:predicted dienelactone hydrolase